MDLVCAGCAEAIVGTLFFAYLSRMRFLIASDIHGAAEPARKIASIYAEGGFDGLLLLGDLLYHGPRNDIPESYAPKSVIELLSVWFLSTVIPDLILCMLAAVVAQRLMPRLSIFDRINGIENIR